MSADHPSAERAHLGILAAEQLVKRRCDPFHILALLLRQNSRKELTAWDLRDVVRVALFMPRLFLVKETEEAGTAAKAKWPDFNRFRAPNLYSPSRPH